MDTKALRQKILDLAIRGKLVPQDPNDEPASVLLERIREQRQQMVKEGKLKKKDIKNDSVIFVGEDNLHYEKFADGTVKCIEDEIPFDVPEGWSWCRYSDVIELYSGQDLTPDRYNDVGDGIPYITGASNLVSEKVLINRWTSTPTTHATKDDLLLTVKGSGVGKMAFCDITDAHIARQIMALRCTKVIKPQYLYIVISSMLSDIIAQANGIIPGIRREIVLGTLLPLPSLREQEKICEKAESSLRIINLIENEKDDLKEFINKVKSKILDLAIRGQLVPQNPDDEPASALLERIRAEKEELIKQGKIKRDKKESFIFKGEDNSYYEKIESVIRCINSEIPFKIPDGWAYERLGNICSVARGGSPRPIENYLTDDENGLNWIKIGDTEQGGKYIFSTKEKIRSDGLNKTRYVHCGDFLLTNSMSFGRPYILKTDGCIHDGWLVIGDVETVFNQDFLYYMLSSSAMYNALSILAAGSTVKNLKSDSVKSLIVPVPPLEEQQAIATQVETLLAIIAQVEKSLN